LQIAASVDDVRCGTRISRCEEKPQSRNKQNTDEARAENSSATRTSAHQRSNPFSARQGNWSPSLCFNHERCHNGAVSRDLPSGGNRVNPRASRRRNGRWASVEDYPFCRLDQRDLPPTVAATDVLRPLPIERLSFDRHSLS
jgi:hypothetical protein